MIRQGDDLIPCLPTGAQPLCKPMTKAQEAAWEALRDYGPMTAEHLSMAVPGSRVGAIKRSLNCIRRGAVIRCPRDQVVGCTWHARREPFRLISVGSFASRTGIRDAGKLLRAGWLYGDVVMRRVLWPQPQVALDVACLAVFERCKLDSTFLVRCHRSDFQSATFRKWLNWIDEPIIVPVTDALRDAAFEAEEIARVVHGEIVAMIAARRGDQVLWVAPIDHSGAIDVPRPTGEGFDEDAMRDWQQLYDWRWSSDDALIESAAGHSAGRANSIGGFGSSSRGCEGAHEDG